MFKFTTSFSSKVRVVTPKEYCEQLSVASLSDLKKLLDEPGIDIDENPDLLLNGFNAAVANRINANDDGIGTADALAYSRRFIHKFTDIEHDRKRIVGHIVSQAFSSFGGNEIVEAESLASTKGAFNISLGAVVYKAVDQNFANLLIESSDETSKNHNVVSASWELGFNEYHILLGHRDFEQGELITDPAKIKELSKFLRAYGGDGVTKEKEEVFRVIVGGLPLGIGYTAAPAAEVEGVIVAGDDDESDASEREVIDLGNSVDKVGEAAADAVASLEDVIVGLDLAELAKESKFSFDQVSEVARAFAKSGLDADETLQRTREAIKLAGSSGLDALKAVESLAAAIETFAKFENTFSQTLNQTVKNTTPMEIKSISDIKGDLFKDEAVASTVIDFIKSEIEKGDEAYKAEVNKKAEEAKSLASQLEDLTKKLDTAAEAQKKSDEKIEELRNAQAAEIADRVFNERMTSLNELYTLSEKVSEVVAKQIRSLDDEAYKGWFENFEVLHAGAKKTEEATASKKEGESAESVLDKVEADAANGDLPNATAAAEVSDYDKYAEAFSGDSISITSR